MPSGSGKKVQFSSDPLPATPGGNKYKDRPKSSKTTKSAKAKEKLQASVRQSEETIVQVKDENDKLTHILTIICSSILSTADRAGVSHIEVGEDYLSLSSEDYVDVLNRIVSRKERMLQDSLEQRVEELETRITQLATELASLLKCKLTYERGLEDIALCGNIYSVRQKVRQLFLDLQSGDPAIDYPFLFHPADGFTDKALKNKLMFSSQDEQEDTIEPLMPPAERFPGDTHITKMNTRLRKYLSKYLNIQKLSGNDWRGLSERVGIPKETTEYWYSLNLTSPTDRVLAEWERSEAATLRMLHRHLASPQMKCFLMAKLIADFYHVE